MSRILDLKHVEERARLHGITVEHYQRKDPAIGLHPCPACNGSGYDATATWDSQVAQVMFTCQGCGGNGIPEALLGAVEMVMQPSGTEIPRAAAELRHMRWQADYNETREAQIAEKGRSARRFGALTTSELMTLPPVRYMLEPFLIAGGFNLLTGPSGTFKSFCALDWAACVATGEHWHGRRPWSVRDSEEVDPGDPPEPETMSALYIAAEGAGGIPARLEAWADSRNRDVPSRMLWIPEAVNFTSPTEVADLIALIDTQDIPALIVIDTLARCMAGGDENSAQDVGRFVAGVDTIRNRYGATILVVHHTGWEEKQRSRGSSALPGAVDVNTLATPGVAPRTVKLSCLKTRDKAEFEPMLLRLELWKDSLVVALATDPAEQRDVDIKTAIVGYVNAHPDASGRAIEKATPARAADVRDALSQLVEDGTLGVEIRGRTHHYRGASQLWDASGRTNGDTPGLGASRVPISRWDAPTESTPYASGSAGRIAEPEDGGW